MRKANGLAPRLRPATAEDLPLYFEWANDPDVRTRSFHTGPISFDDHKTWFAAKLASPSVLMLVLECGGAVGQIRYDVVDDVAVIGFSLAGSARGRGLGSYLLRAGARQLHVLFPGVRLIRGLVKRGNTGSVRAFDAAGFHVAMQTFEAGFPTLVYEIDVARLDYSNDSA